MIILKGFQSDGTRWVCDATCHTAKSRRCRCGCRGRFHGVGVGTRRDAAVVAFREEILATKGAVLGELGIDCISLPSVSLLLF